MLGHVADALAARQASETRVRQFVADASHELRTPLAAIRGYAELTRRGRDQVPADVAHALGRVESESTRMTSLVDDLLLLARLDSGRPLAREPVDLTAPGGRRGQRRARRRSATTAGGSTCPTSGDPGARRRRPAAPGGGQPARQRPDAHPARHHRHHHAGRRRRRRRASPSPTTGPGIPAELQPDIFERFARGDSSRSRARRQHRPRPGHRGRRGRGAPRHGRGAEPSRPDTAFVVRCPAADRSHSSDAISSRLAQGRTATQDAPAAQEAGRIGQNRDP